MSEIDDNQIIPGLSSDDNDESDNHFSQDNTSSGDEISNSMEISRIKIPNIKRKFNTKRYFVKLSNFLSLENEPFDKNTFKGERLDARYMDSEGRIRHKLKMHNTIRWRQIQNKNGQFDRESNSRFVKWSDGSMTLHVGSEVFNVITTPILHSKDQLFIRQVLIFYKIYKIKGELLLSKGVFNEKMTFCPSSTESKTHKRVIAAVADRAVRTQKVKLLSTIRDDDEKARIERIKIEEEKLKAFEKLDLKRQQRKERNLNHSKLSSVLFDAENEENIQNSDDSHDNSISVNYEKTNNNDYPNDAQEIFGSDSTISSTGLDSD